MMKVYRRYFGGDIGRLVRETPMPGKLKEFDVDNNLSVDFQVGEGKIEEMIGEAMLVAYEYQGIPTYN